MIKKVKSRKATRALSSRFMNKQILNSKRSAHVPSSRFMNKQILNSKRSQQTGYHKLIIILLALLAAVLLLIFLINPSWRDWLANLPVFKIMLGEKKSLVMSKEEMIVKILNFYNIQEIKYENKILVFLSYGNDYNPDCDDPFSNSITLVFLDGRNEEIDFFWDAKKNKAYARRTGESEIYDADFFRKDFNEIEKVFKDLTNGEDKKIIDILNAKSFNEFYLAIYGKYINDKDIGIFLNSELVDRLKEEGKKLSSKEDLTQVVVYDALTFKKSDYNNNWISPEGACKKNIGKYKCFFGENVSYEGEDCLFIATGSKFCLEGKEKECGNTCLCPENYEPGFVISSVISGKTWEFKISVNGYNKKCVSSNCEEQEKKGEEVRTK